MRHPIFNSTCVVGGAIEKAKTEDEFLAYSTDTNVRNAQI